MKYKHLALILPALLLAGCGAQQPQSTAAESAPAAALTADETPTASGEIFAMDTYMTITCYGENCEAAVQAAEAEIERLDAMLSVGNAESEISVINANGSGPVSDDTAAMIERALEVYRTTDGAFDITVYPLMQLWGFTTGNFAVPDEASLQAALARVGSDTVQCADGKVTLADGQGIDLGGIAKGFTSDRLMEVFAEYGLSGGLVSLGGNVQFYGTKPDGTLWRCGIQDPHAPDGDSYLGVLQTSSNAVITSGAYERYFTDEATGKTYHHILDPATGYPAQSGLISVTIVTPQGVLGDGLSTACYVMGLDKSIDYWRQYGTDFDLILMTDDDTVYITEPLAESFESDYPTYVITQEGVTQR